MGNKLEIKQGFDGELYVIGEHISVKTAEKLLLDYDNKYEVINIEKIYVRHGILPIEVREEENQRGWWVVEKIGRGVGKASCILVRRKIRCSC